MPSTTRLNLKLLYEGQVSEGLYNANISIIDGVLTCSVIDVLSTPPGSPVENDSYLIGAAATGDWTSKEDNLTILIDGVWVFIAPVNGMMLLQRETSPYKHWTYNTGWTQAAIGPVKRTRYFDVNDGVIGAGSPALGSTVLGGAAYQSWALDASAVERVDHAFTLPKNFDSGESWNPKIWATGPTTDAANDGIAWDQKLLKFSAGDDLNGTGSVQTTTLTEEEGKTQDVLYEASPAAIAFSGSEDETMLCILKTERTATSDDYPHDIRVHAIGIEYSDTYNLIGAW